MLGKSDCIQAYTLQQVLDKYISSICVVSHAY